MGASVLSTIARAQGSALAAAAIDPALATALALGGLVVAGLAWIVLHREALRRVLLAAVDPRPLALFRIAFGVCLLIGVLEAWPLAGYLYSDEGLLTSAAAIELYGREALAGYGAGEGGGFADLGAVLRYLAGGRWSIHFFFDDPWTVAAAQWALVAACVGLVLGVRTRTCAVIAWLLLAGMLRRGDAHWGGEQVYVSFLFLLMLGRAGEAFSVDNLRRCRALRGRGLLSEPGGPGEGAGAPPSSEHPQGLAAIYRRIPAWPQALIAVQLAICYAANGWAKSGALWESGDALYYALHLETYARVDGSTIALSLGTWPLRLATWTVVLWERLFPLVLVGLWIDARARVAAAPRLGRARALARIAALLAALAVGALAVLGESALGGLLAAALASVALLGGRGLLVDRARLARTILAPRLWLGIGVAFHLVNLLLFNVGMFALATMSAYLVVGAGPWAIGIVQRIGRRLSALGAPVAPHLSRERAIDAEDPALPHLHRDDAALPAWAIAAAGVLLIVGLVAAMSVDPAPSYRMRWIWHGATLLAAILVMGVGRRAARRARGVAPGLTRPWAYGPAGRTAAAGVVAYHLIALTIWQLPAGPRWPFRKVARGLVDPWLELTFTRQRWQMFAPDPPRFNRSVRTTVIDGAGVRHDLRTELALPDNRPRPYLWPDRRRKVDEAIAGQRPDLAAWHARALCRRWALDHRGDPARTVLLERVVAPMPAPGEARAGDPWANANVEPILAIGCASEPFAQLDPELRRRHDLPPAPPGTILTTWPEGQDKTWAARVARIDHLTPLWTTLALGLVLGFARWSREDRRRHVEQVRAQRGSGDTKGAVRDT
ncbi:MAG: hypothetical protein R3B09_11355 [Nannocystaceae bacterium]